MTISKNIWVGSIVLATLVLLALPLTFAKAADLDIPGGFDYIDTSFPLGFGGGYDYIDTSYPTSFGGGYDYIDTSYSSYSDSFSSSGSAGSSFSSYLPYSISAYIPSSAFSYSYPVSRPGVSTYTSNTNVNACTNGSCNTIVDDHSVVNANTTINAPTTINGGGSSSYPVYYPVYQPSYPSYASYPTYYPINYDYCINLSGMQYSLPAGYYVQNGYCYQNSYYPTPNPAPYVALSSVPYTGFELGPVGTALYWGFLVLWCAGAAYLIAVKRVQTKIVAGLNSFLYGLPAQAGSTPVATSASTSVAPTITAPAPNVAPVETKVQAVEEGIDPFILSQIKRTK